MISALKRTGPRAGALALTGLLLLAPGAEAKPGALDRGFGDRGRVVFDGLDGGADLQQGYDAVPYGGGVLIAGGRGFGVPPAVMLLRPDGSPDPAFGSGGIVVLELPNEFTSSLALAVQADGRIVVAVRSADDLRAPTVTLVRLLPDGGLDGSFGAGGVAETGLDLGDGTGLGMALDEAGRVNVVGGGDPGGLLAARFLADGAPDPGFSGDGVSVTTIDPGRGGGASAVAALPGGGLLVAGGSGSGPKRGAAVIRLGADGELDPSFARAGVFRKRFGRGGGASAADLAAAPGGRVALVANRLTGRGREQAVIARLRANGKLDRSFSRDGVRKLGKAPRFKGRALEAVIAQANGRVIAAGRDHKEFLVLRLKTSGRPDRAFAGRRGATTGFRVGRSAVAALAFLPRNRLLALGTRTITSALGRSTYYDAVGAAYRLR